MKVRLGVFERLALYWEEPRGFDESKEGSGRACPGAAGDLRSRDPEAGETEMPLHRGRPGAKAGAPGAPPAPGVCPRVSGATAPRSYEQTLWLLETLQEEGASWELRGTGGGGSRGLVACSGRVKGGGREVPVSPDLPAAASQGPLVPWAWSVSPALHESLSGRRGP